MEEGFYYVDAAGKRQGPFGINQLRGLISPNTLVWTKGMTGWVPAGWWHLPLWATSCIPITKSNKSLFKKPTQRARKSNLCKKTRDIPGSITCLATLANTLSQWIFMWMLMAIFRGNTPTPNMAIVWTLTALIPPMDTYLSKSANRDKVW